MDVILHWTELYFFVRASFFKVNFPPEYLQLGFVYCVGIVEIL